MGNQDLHRPEPASDGFAMFRESPADDDDPLRARAERAAQLGVPDLPPEEGPRLPEWGAGGEIVPRGADNAHPGLAEAVRRDNRTIVEDGSLERCRLADQAGVLTLALDTAEAVLPKSSVDKSVAHHLALAHTLAMRFGGYALQALTAAEAGKDSAAPVALRSARTSARMISAYRESCGLLERVRDQRFRRLGWGIKREDG